jgi:hypothetical protein
MAKGSGTLYTFPQGIEICSLKTNSLRSFARERFFKSLLIKLVE